MLKNKGQIWNKINPHTFYLGSLVLFICFVLYPILSQYYFGLFEWPGFGPTIFIGTKNYRDMLNSNAVKVAFKNNLIFFAIYFVGLNLHSLITALLLSVKFRGKLLITRGNAFFRVAFFAPAVISQVVMATILRHVFRNQGILNYLLTILHLDFLKQNWLADPNLVLYTIAITSIVFWFGYYTLIYYAGITNIPEELLEAANIDGATLFQSLRYIVLPLLKQAFIMVSVLTFIGSFRIFELPLILTQGGPGYASTVVSLLVVIESLRYFKYGYGVAISSIVTLFLFGAIFFYIKYFSKGIKR